MVDPCLSLAGFAIGALGFVVSTRNNVQRLLEDIDHFKYDLEVLPVLGAQLCEFSDRLKMWSQFWYVHEKTPDKHFVQLWGRPGSEMIIDLLRSIEHRASRLCREVESRYRITIDVNRAEKGQADSTKSGVQLSTYRRLINLLKRDMFAEILQALDSELNWLHALSRSRFISHVCRNQEHDWEAYVPSTVLRHSLQALASAATSQFNALQIAVSKFERHHFDMQLSHGVSPSDRLDKLSEWARYRTIPVHLLVSFREIHVDVHHRVAIIGFRSSTTDGHRSHSRDKMKRDDAVHTLSDLEGSETASVCPFKNAAPTDRRTMRSDLVEKDFTLFRTDTEFENSIDLKTFIGEEQSDWSTNLHGVFTKAHRTQIAYELSEFAGLLLKANNFLGSLCSCAVRVIENDGPTPSFAVRFHTVQHTDPDIKSPWCAEELRQMPLRRFGVLLVEIALGQMVYEAIYNKRRKTVKIDFKDTSEVPTEGLESILRRVHHEAGRDFRDVIAYCLTHEAKPAASAKEEIDLFYGSVVAPLWFHYNEEVIERARRRERALQRRSRKGKEKVR